MLNELNVNWPEFDFEDDFEFDWDLDENPHIYNIFFYGYFDDDYDVLEESWQIDGSEEEFSIANSLYVGYEDWEYWEIDIYIDAVNYVNHGKCLTWTQTTDSFYDENWECTQTQIEPIERIRRTIKLFQQKFSK